MHRRNLTKLCRFENPNAVYRKPENMQDELPLPTARALPCISSVPMQIPVILNPTILQSQRVFLSLISIQGRRGEFRRRASWTSPAALVRDRYAVHAIPTVDTNGCKVYGLARKSQRGRILILLTSWNCTGIKRKLMTCTAGHSR